MKMNGNTILITGGGSGIGKALAEAFHQLDNQVIIAGRRVSVLDEATNANPGMRSLELDIEDPKSISAFAAKVNAEFPTLNVIIHNAGIMRPEAVLKNSDNLGDAEAMIATNLLGPIRLNTAFLPLLRKQKEATIMTVSSGLAFVPMAATPTYCATKAAIHSYSLSLRHQLKDTNIKVVELAPPYVQTHLMGEGQANDPRAMPLKEFIDEVIAILQATPDVEEVIVKRCLPLRNAIQDGKFDQMFEMLTQR